MFYVTDTWPKQVWREECPVTKSISVSRLAVTCECVPLCICFRVRPSVLFVAKGNDASMSNGLFTWSLGLTNPVQCCDWDFYLSMYSPFALWTLECVCVAGLWLSLVAIHNLQVTTLDTRTKGGKKVCVTAIFPFLFYIWQVKCDLVTFIYNLVKLDREVDRRAKLPLRLLLMVVQGVMAMLLLLPVLLLSWPSKDDAAVGDRGDGCPLLGLLRVRIDLHFEPFDSPAIFVATGTAVWPTIEWKVIEWALYWFSWSLTTNFRHNFTISCWTSPLRKQ